MKYIPHGIVTALVTCFSDDGQIDEERSRRSVEFQIQNGVDGLCPLGGTGEPLSLSEEEYKRVIGIVMDQVAGRVPVIVGALLVPQNVVVRIIKYAGSRGAAAAMIIPPYFVRTSQEHIARHFSDLAAATDLPLVVFNTPSRAGVNLDAAFMVRLAREIDAIVAVKESSGNLEQAARIVAEAPPDFSVMQGSDVLQLASWSVGARGGIVALANLVPTMFTEMYAAFQRGDMASARRLQQIILPLNSLAYSESHPAPLKRALNMVGRTAGPTRPPVYSVSEETDHRLRTVLGALGLPCSADWKS